MTTEMTAPDKRPADAPETARGGRIYRPLADIVERDGTVTLLLEMPGVAAADVEIALENRVLTISGHAGTARPGRLQLVHAEYGEGDYERAFTLSEDIDPDRIEAEMKDGLLRVTLPRAEAAQPKKIAVRSA
ncbi:Hsp20/alpha crystallin family protein [Rhodovulum sulfidophilum]|uniref:Hsp20/alpha crystallin family protein n=1 Tax=Rhodovulum sulfidophilum TaxID=35806 RepID=UPI0019213F2F|nr:Hsp20/alpha crystallin family protein [Rhodovulum sulfidophilum]MBL3597466.1 Hsp20/alpha crystallin family protein [Rhodovulum sulfidophilum]